MNSDPKSLMETVEKIACLFFSLLTFRNLQIKKCPKNFCKPVIFNFYKWEIFLKLVQFLNIGILHTPYIIRYI